MEGNEKCRADGYVQGRKGITNYHTMNMKVVSRQPQAAHRNIKREL